MAALTSGTLTVKDRNGFTVYTASVGESATTTTWADKYGGTAEYTPLRTPMVGNITVTIATAQLTQATVTGYIYYENAGAVRSHAYVLTFDHSNSESVTLDVGGYFLGATTVVSALVSPSLSPSISPSLSASISPSLSSSVSPSASLSPSLSPSISPSRSPSISPSISSSVSPSASLSPSISPSLSPST